MKYRFSKSIKIDIIIFMRGVRGRERERAVKVISSFVDANEN